MHGRSEFTGKRRICGGYSELAGLSLFPTNPSSTRQMGRRWLYLEKCLLTLYHLLVNRDDFMSRYLNTNYSREEIFQRFI